MNKPPYKVVTEIGLAVEATKIALGLPSLNYQYGYLNEVDKTLMQDNKVVEIRALSFPLVVVKQPFDVVSIGRGWYGKTKGLDIIICTNTEVGLKAKQRQEEKFIPMLDPIMEELLKQLGYSPAFDNWYPQRMQVRSTDLYFWGDQPGVKSVMTDILDAKIIRDLELKVNNNKNCSVPGVLERNANL